MNVSNEYWFSLKNLVPLSLRVSNLAGHVIFVDNWILQKHVQTALVLRERMAGHLVHELLEAFASILDEVLFEQSIITAERHLPLPRLARQRRHDNLAITLELRAQPLKVRISSPHRRFFLFEDRQVRLFVERRGSDMM